MATSDYASPAQARLMRARAHGWRPKNPRKKLPSRAVADEFVEAKDRKYAGGFAENRYQMGGLINRLLTENPEYATAIRMAQRGERYDPGGTEPVQVGGLGAVIPGRVAPITTRVLTAAGPPVAPPPRRGRESPHRERLRAHKTRIEDILRGEPRRVKGPKAPSGPIKEMQRGGILRNLSLMQHPGIRGGLAQMMARKTRGAPRQVPIKQPPMGGGRAWAGGSPGWLGRQPRGPGTFFPAGGGMGIAAGRHLSAEERGQMYDREQARRREVGIDPLAYDRPTEGAYMRGQGDFMGPGRTRMPPIQTRNRGLFGGVGEAMRRAQQARADRGMGAPPTPRGGMGMLGMYGRHRGMGGPRRGGVFGALQQAMMQRQGMRPGGIPRRGGQPPPVGPRGGPQFPPNLMGMFQRMRMMNRPRMGGVGGGNRVGQADQQGALARALQRGTGRPPMSRRYAFPGRR